MRDFLKSSGYYRVASHKSFDSNISPLYPPHACCNFCNTLGGCTKPCRAFEKKPLPVTMLLTNCRNVSVQEKIIINDELSELEKTISQSIGSSAFGHHHGFSKELVSDVVVNCTVINCLL